MLVMSRSRAAIGAFCAVSWLSALYPTSARADDAPPENRTLATALFQEGRKLLEENRVAEACRKFEESERLDSGGGTLLNLAACHEREGRTASAWTEFEGALAQARRDGREDRAQIAAQRMAVLEPRLSRVTIVVAASSDRADLEITLDGTPVRRPAWGVGMPVDPGDHAIEAHAPNAKPWRSTIAVHGDGETPSVAVPALEIAPTVAEPAAAAPPAPPTVAPLPSLASSETPLAPRVPLWRDATMITAAIVGVAGVAFGTYFGLHAVALDRDAASGCPGGRCTPGASTTSDHAVANADASTGAFIAGGVGLGLATVLLLTRHAKVPNVTASIDARGASVGWTARF
jgi:hypothetical protein